VENKLTAELFCMRFKPNGPTIVPDIISEIMVGILNFLNNIQDMRMINNIREKVGMGNVNGNLKMVDNSCIRL